MQGSIRSTESIINLMNNAPFLTMLLIFTFLVIWFTLRMRLRLLRFVETSIVNIINKEVGKKINITNKEIHSINEEIRSLKESREKSIKDYKNFQEEVKNELIRIRRHEYNNSKAQLDALDKLNSNFDKYGDKL